MVKWMLRQSSANIEEIARQSRVDPVLARILAVRGLRTAQEQMDFLSTGELSLASPLCFADMEQAIAIAITAIEEHRRCVIFGDYDVDGVMSTTILYRTLSSLGADVAYYIPQREDGYGMNDAAIYDLHARGFDIIFACDNGISAFSQIALANSLGLSTVILDHHAVQIKEDASGLPMQVLPAAAAVVDAHRIDCPYPYKQYCAAGLCLRFSSALYDALGLDWSKLDCALTPLATIATICDLVELTGENRALVRYGLPMLGKNYNLGLSALIEAVGMTDKPLNVSQVGFILGPCINASGRLDSADTAVDLFLTEDLFCAKQLAAKLVALNQQRRKFSEEGAEQAIQTVLTQDLQSDKVIVLHCREIPESIAGIVAGRVRERYARPSLVLVGDQALVRGSGRSVEGYNIYEALFSCRDLLEMFGGHPMAAGLTMARENIDTLRMRMNQECRLTEEELEPLHRIDCPLLPVQANLSLAHALQKMAPFGKGNPEPIFASKQLCLTKLTLLGKEGRVLRWQFCTTDGMNVEAIDFSGPARQEYIEKEYGTAVWESLLAGQPPVAIWVDILYHLTINVFNGRESAQLRLIDFRPSTE